MKLEPETEEVATFYAKMLDHDYTTKEVFNQNFYKDWRKVRNMCICISQGDSCKYDVKKIEYRKLFIR